MYIICKHYIYIYIYKIYVNKDTVGKRCKIHKNYRVPWNESRWINSDNLVYFFLSSTCTIFIWHSITIIRTARNRGIGSYLLEFPCQYFHPHSRVSCSLELSFLFCLQLFYSFYRFLYILFTSPFFLKYVSFLCNLSQKRKGTHTSSQPVLLGAVLLGCVCLTYIVIFHNITTCQERQPFSCLLILTHITIKWNKRKGHRQTIWMVCLRCWPFLEPLWTNCFLLSK